MSARWTKNACHANWELLRDEFFQGVKAGGEGPGTVSAPMPGGDCVREMPGVMLCEGVQHRTSRLVVVAADFWRVDSLRAVSGK